MSSTPRLRSGYPATPATSAVRRRSAQETPTPNTDGSFASTTGSTRSPTLPLAPQNAPEFPASEPVIPLTILDGPQQRLLALAVWGVLFTWKVLDWLQLVQDGDGSWWLFLKWTLIDFTYLFCLPELRIPWLELSQFVVITFFSAHLLLNYAMMFNITLPFQTAFFGVLKLLYDREISISEHNVKPADYLNNNSLIMGKQVINILPEGSAILNPEQAPFCMTPKSKSVVAIPIHFNATVPAEIEFIRTDLYTGKEEVLKVSSREVGKIAKQIRDYNADPDLGFYWEYPIKKTGVYRLGKVLDEYKLEVQRSSRDTYVVPCPQAKFKTTDSAERCIGDKPDLSLEVIGTPPLMISFNRAINGKNHDFRYQKLQPDDFTSPMTGSSSALVAEHDRDVSWVRPATVPVTMNEFLSLPGVHEYSVEEIRDAFGNTVQYAQPGEEADKTKSVSLNQRLTVKERPKARMRGCDLRNPLKVAKNRATFMPVMFSGSGNVDDTRHYITYEFSPLDSLTNSGDHGDKVTLERFESQNSYDKPSLKEPGLYTLKSVSTGTCEGEVDEPSSCLLLNPLEPHLSLRTEEIPDKCAGNTIGLRVDLDLVGTPPFAIHYDVISDGRVSKKVHRVNGLRSQLELVPKTAGRHKYLFKAIDDSVYTGLSLAGSDKTLEQVVKPAASAWIQQKTDTISACLDSEIEVEVGLLGDAPFSLEWEIVHEGKRKSQRVADIQENTFKIKTAALAKGGDYILALSSVQDQRGCRSFLQDQVKISVRRQRPRASFAAPEQKRSITAVADTPQRLPLRLQGEGPWTVSYRNLNESGSVVQKKAQTANDYILAKSQGVYEITDVRDSQCPGTVDTSASTFSLDWYPRPEISLVENERITGDAGHYIMQEVCEGDIDVFDVSLKGSPPYHIQYEVKHKPLQGSSATSRKDFDAPQSKAAITADTVKPGDYIYKFSGLADNLYDSQKNLDPLTVHQRVNAKPSAAFAKPGQSYKSCLKEQEHEEKLPITLNGVAPFFVEVEIKHQSGAASETYRIPGITTKSYNMQIPRQYLSLGSQQVRIRTVRDARGCQQKYEFGGPSVQIHVYDAPSIYALETRKDYCVGDRIAYTLSGTPPFDILYDFNGQRHAKSQTTSFRRFAEGPGEFTITSIADKASECRAAVNISKTIHPLPSVQISQGRQSHVDIHEGGEVDIQFDFWGTPPFEFTYTRSTNAKKGQRSVILETRHDVSYESRKIIKATQEGTYEVVAIKDTFCSFSTQQLQKSDAR